MLQLKHAVIKYVPDLFRGESMNVGVLVVAPQARYAQYKINYRSKTRLSYLDGSYHRGILEAFEENLQHHIERIRRRDADPEHELADMRAKFITSVCQLGEIGITEVEGPAAEQHAAHHCQTLVADLFDMLVQPTSGGSADVPQAEKERPKFEAALERHDLLEREGRKGVQKRYKIDLGASGLLGFDYGFKNGHVHVFESVDLDEAKRTDTVAKNAGGAFFKFLEARTAVREQQDDELAAYTLLHGSEKKVRVIREGMERLGEESRLVHVDNPDELNGLLVDIKRAIES